MNYVRAMPPKSKFTCTTWYSSCLGLSSSGFAREAPAPCWRCSTCIQRWSRLHRRFTFLTMTKTMLAESTGTEGKCPSPSLTRSPLRRAPRTSSQRRSLNASSRWTPPSSCWSSSANPPPELCLTTLKFWRARSVKTRPTTSLRSWPSTPTPVRWTPSTKLSGPASTRNTWSAGSSTFLWSSSTLWTETVLSRTHCPSCSSLSASSTYPQGSANIICISMLPGDSTVCDLTLSSTSAWQAARGASIQRWTRQWWQNCRSSFTPSIRSFTRSLVEHSTGHDELWTSQMRFLDWCFLFFK